MKFRKIAVIQSSLYNRREKEYEKNILAGIAFAVAMAIVWSTVFTSILGTSGIGVGVAFGAAFYFVGILMFKTPDSKDTKNDQSE